MQIYLPIAEVSVNAFLLLGLGGLVGILSGMFGVGGGFLMTPLLFFIGIPPAVAVATEANQIVASSFSGALAHFRRKTFDLKMGGVLLIGGLAGAALGVVVFNYLKSMGQVDLLVKLCYVVFLSRSVAPHRRRLLYNHWPWRPRARGSERPDIAGVHGLQPRPYLARSESSWGGGEDPSGVHRNYLCVGR